jgi:hypothetical protein
MVAPLLVKRTTVAYTILMESNAIRDILLGVGRDPEEGSDQLREVKRGTS